MASSRLIISALITCLIMIHSYDSKGMDPEYPKSSSSQPPPIIDLASSSPNQITPLPRGYKPIPYAQQFEAYHNIFDKIDLQNYNFVTTHLPGLFEILKYGFAKVTDYIVIDEAPKRDKKQALDHLKTLYTFAIHLQNNKQLSQAYFLAINLFMATLIDHYKGITPEEFEDYGKMSLYDPHLINNVLETGDLRKLEDLPIIEFPIPIYKKNIMVTKVNADDPEIKEYFIPFVAVIYKGTQGISPRTFVDQKFANDHYNLEITLFDTTLVPYRMTHQEKEKFGTKSDPHYSKFNSTFSLLSHDIAHISEQVTKEDFFWANYGINWSQELKLIHKIRQKFSPQMSQSEYDKNIYRILTNGLFILSHELQNVTALPPPLLSGVSPIPVPPFYQLSIIDAIEFIKDYMKTYVRQLKFPPEPLSPIVKKNIQAISGLPEALDLIYKRDFRDHEFILNTILDKDGQPILPITNEQVKKLPTGQYKKYMKELIIQGYEKFWNYFVEILIIEGNYCHQIKTEIGKKSTSRHCIMM